MIRPFLDEEDAWCYWVVSVGALLSFLGLVAACICSCRRNENKNEFLGLAGMVTLNNSETDGFNRIPVLDVSQVVAQDVNDGGKRTASANRSLPDIPKDKSREHENMVESVPQDIYETTETMEDHSELYATVQDAAQEQISEREAQEVTQQSSLTQDISHQYTRFASPISDNVEHPYAQVQNVQKTEASQVNSNVNQIVNIEKPSTSTGQPRGNPVAPPRARRSSSHNSLLSSESHCDIQAANAISGGVQANQDLPYMTPPLLMLLPHPPHSQHNSPQQHFSGDSQDSKGYTSISVREPLANIIAQTKAAYRQNQSTRPITDPHYATVSDDSDEMYAAIDEQDKVYTSGSETYAQIQPTTLDAQRQAQHEQPVFCQAASRTEETHPAPQPPSVDSLRHVAHAHSRQASSSSATSSIINPGSPKPEKRQANSPLPPPPEASAEGYASVDKSKGKTDERSRSSLSMGKSLEDMYAKVMKKKKEVEEQQQQQQQQQQADTHPSVNNVLHPEASTYRKLSLIEISRASWCSHESVEIQKKEPDGTHYAAAGSAASNFHVESESNSSLKLPKPERDATLPHIEIDHGYEAVDSTSNDRRNSAARGIASLSDPNYEMLRSQSARENDYQSNSISARNSADASYSVPFKHRQVSNASSEDPGYEKVRLRRRVELLDQDTDSEPNYESMPHDTGEPNYASVCRPGDSDTDPNYESVSHGDPNYESVKYMTVTRNEEPPYEQVMNNFPVDTNADGYEKVKDKKATTNADYEKINLNNTLERISNGGDTDDEQYVQV
ncbi:AF4/FMR2 family member 4 isoform X2 [Ooceraea biroi]|uniref:AF4/FMR2 family member 4 isoform X2 n=1 Tax=Ooceraea biroi TaxID=2015173 RepID=UPI0005B90C52|nr:AF4/FMR2 family member 4 isoform X2 [Ooceraea biroi]